VTRDAALAVAIVSFCGAVAWTLINADPPPMVGSSTREVTYTVAPTATVTATVTATPTATRTVTVSRDRQRVGALQARIRWCESRDNYKAQNPTSSASGGYGFLDSTWRSITGLPGSAKDYPPALQDKAFRDLYAQLGTRPWSASRGCWG